MMNRDELAQMEQLVLTKIRARAMTYIHPAVFDSVGIAAADFMADDLYVAALNLIIPTKATFDVERSESVPLTWHDHLLASLGLKHRKRHIATKIVHHHQCPHIRIGESQSLHIDWLRYAGEPEKLMSAMTMEDK